MATDVVCPTCNTVSHFDDLERDAGKAFAARATTLFSGPTGPCSLRPRLVRTKGLAFAGSLAPKVGLSSSGYPAPFAASPTC